MRIDADLKEKLSAKAKAENRTLSNYIETILKMEIEDSGVSDGINKTTY